MQKPITPQSESQSLQAGQVALSRAAWAEARSCFEAALRCSETPEALDGLGTATWWLNDIAVTFEARVRAYQLYRERGDWQSAVRLATHLAIDHLYSRGEYAIANGWVQRAQRLLAGIGPHSLHGWLALTEAQIKMWAHHDFAAAQRLCAHAASVASSQGDTDLEMLALASEGLSMISQGMVGEGMQRLDAATLAAVTGEISNVDASCTACCFLIYACEWTRDYERMAQWIERLKLIATRWAHPTMFAFCRVHYASLLVGQGAWAEAEAELATAIDKLKLSQPAMAGEALVRLADLLCRQGRLAEAAALLEQAEAPGFRALVSDLCMLGRATLALAQDDTESAIELAERCLRSIPKSTRIERVAGLELLVQGFVARGNYERARAALDELRADTALVATKHMQGAARFAEGLLKAVAADHDAARRCFEDAADLWVRSGSPFEAARARIELARALLALGRHQVAEQHAQAALDTLQQLGAQPDGARAAALLRAIHSAQGPAPERTAGLGDLTPREVEVLRLIAAGKSNQEIAAELVLSVRTVERHISNVYIKIGASGTVARATATAYALHHGLTQV